MDIQMMIRHQAEQNTVAMREVSEFLEKAGEKDQRARELADGFDVAAARMPPIRGELDAGATKEANGRIYTAADYKEAGTRFFQGGDYKSALRYYEQAARMERDSEIHHGNVGLCHAKLGNNAKALKAYTRALDLDPGYTKVLVRRGRLLMLGQNYEGALADFCAALALLPSGKRGEVQRDIDTLRKCMHDSASTAPRGSSVAIEVEDEDESSGEDIAVNADRPPPGPPTDPAPAPAPELGPAEVSAEASGEAPPPSASSAPVAPASSAARAEKTASTVPLARASVGQVEGATPTDTAQHARIAANVGVGVGVVACPPPPESSYTFYVDIRQLMSHPDVLAEYLNSFHTGKLPSLLSSQITEEELTAIVAALRLQRLSAKKTINIVFTLLKLPKFSLIQQFMRPSLRTAVLSVLSWAEAQVEGDSVMATRIGLVREGYGAE